MEASTIFCLIFFGIIVSLQLLCRPIINHYNSERYMNINNHIASISRINNHSEDHDNNTNNNIHKHTKNVSLVPALFVFGDSTVDAGNNNHIITISRSNFPPYGRDLTDKKPSGRFCNGRLVIDYIGMIFTFFFILLR